MTNVSNAIIPTPEDQPAPTFNLNEWRKNLKMGDVAFANGNGIYNHVAILDCKSEMVQVRAAHEKTLRWIPRAYLFRDVTPMVPGIWT